MSDESGWRVRHCGHPTANWPYYATDPRHPARIVATHNGLGFQRLESAFELVEDVIARRRTICVRPSTRWGPVACISASRRAA